ncbi:MAG: hypothetical protein CSA70_01440 [Rhodobacterales bacterium]|nr:MAG: hypothetical protein CSA70_01440 [Rhodobacterales bacterium]
MTKINALATLVTRAFTAKPRCSDGLVGVAFCDATEIDLRRAGENSAEMLHHTVIANRYS